MVSNAAGFSELIFLVLVFAIYLLLARRPGQGLRKGMAGRIEARIKNYLSVKMMLSVVVLAPIPHTAQRASTPLCESNERAERATTTTTRDDELPDPTVRHRQHGSFSPWGLPCHRWARLARRCCGY